MGTLIWIAALAAGAVFLVRRQAGLRARREAFIETYAYPAVLARKLRERYPGLSEGDAFAVMRGLKDYFHLCRVAGARMVSMPSQAVDHAWHEFILHTQAYQRFCDAAFGRFLHHTPAEAMKAPTQAQAGIRRAWKLACRRENINAAAPRALPLLFALDERLGIPDGFRYRLNCHDAAIAGAVGVTFCASDIGCSSTGGCVGDSGSGSDGGGGGGSDGGSSGCGGGGCGGGGGD